MTIFVTGCTHFGHANIIKLAERPFESVEQMDEAMIHLWNKRVGKKDTIYHLGDFSFRSVREPERYLDRLNGNIIFIRGNHDREGWGVMYQEVKFMKRRFIMFHYPIEEWNGWYGGSIHLHCHTHEPEFISAKRRFNVGVDATGFAPVSLDEIIEEATRRWTK